MSLDFLSPACQLFAGGIRLYMTLMKKRTYTYDEEKVTHSKQLERWSLPHTGNYKEELRKWKW